MDQDTISKIYGRALRKGFGGDPRVMYKKYGPPVPVEAPEAYKIMAKLESVLSGHVRGDSHHIKEDEGKLHVKRQSRPTSREDKLKERPMSKASLAKDRLKHSEDSEANSQARQAKVKGQHRQYRAEKRTRHSTHNGLKASLPDRSK